MTDYTIECQLAVIGDRNKGQRTTLYAGPYVLPFLPSKGMELHFTSPQAMDGSLHIRCRCMEWWQQDGSIVVHDRWETEKDGCAYQEAIDFCLGEGWRREPAAREEAKPSPGPKTRQCGDCEWFRNNYCTSAMSSYSMQRLLPEDDACSVFDDRWSDKPAPEPKRCGTCAHRRADGWCDLTRPLRVSVPEYGTACRNHADPQTPG